MYMVYTVIGSLFLIVFGVEIAYNYVWLDLEDPPLEGHPVTFNSTGHMIPVVVSSNGCLRLIRVEP